MTLWPQPPANFPALKQSVHVWAVRLDQEGVDLARAQDFISADEAERAERFMFDRDRRRYLVAHMALHGILKRYLPSAPATLRFEIGTNGKPRLPNALAASGVRFNLSHSNEMALLAVTHGREIGVDIEYVKEQFEFQEIAEKFFTAREVAAMRSVVPQLQRQAFFKCWTSKEAFLKAKGTGLSGKLDEVEISLAADQRVQINAAVPGWSLTELAAMDGYETALVIEGEPLPVHCYQWQPHQTV
jgi:4'-phosphopantetheinyl transferase